LRHPDQAEAYLKRRDEEATELRRLAESLGIARTPEESAKWREELRARWAARQGQDHAPPSD
jgi:hypothetical protein